MSSLAALPTYEASLFRVLADSDTLHTHRDALAQITGLELELRAISDLWREKHPPLRSESLLHLPFCDQACPPWSSTCQRLQRSGSSPRPPSGCPCFQHLCRAVVPVRLGVSDIGYLRLAPLLRPLLDDSTIYDRLTELVNVGVNTGDTQRLRKAFLELQGGKARFFHTAFTILQQLAGHLAQEILDPVLSRDTTERAAITRARHFIHAHLNIALPLPIVAREAGLSESHFCRIFKEVTNFTLTGYIASCRISWAQRELRWSDDRISEIAFRVGFHSLSQFNRTFARVTGCSPTTYRNS